MNKEIAASSYGFGLTSRTNVVLPNTQSKEGGQSVERFIVPGGCKKAAPAMTCQPYQHHSSLLEPAQGANMV